MDLVAGAMCKLPSKLLELLRDEYKLHKSVRPHIEFLSRELESMHTTLCQVVKVPPDELDPQIRLWYRDVREASFSMDIALDACLAHADGGGPQPAVDPDRDRVKRLLNKMGKLFSLSKVKRRREVAGAIMGIKRQLEELESRRVRFGIDDAVVKQPPPATNIDPRLSVRFTQESNLVGIDEARDQLVKVLSLSSKDEPNRGTKIVTVTGIGGLGKTTLATVVYGQLEVDFICNAFVSVGQNPDLKRVLTDILVQLDRQYYTSRSDLMVLDERKLIDEIRNFLHDKRYFIVVDDIWDSREWKIIKYALMERRSGSVILMTTRRVDIAENDGYVYRLPQLSESDCRTLFYGRLFGSEDKRPPGLADICEKFIEKCCGVPLAIIKTVSLLNSQASRTVEVWQAMHDSLGYSSHEGPCYVMRNMFAPSYTDLPAHLKSCLLYLSLFPKGHEICGEYLVRLWIAEDFIHETEENYLHEIGEFYLGELINRSFIEPVKVDACGKVLSCRVHNCFHDLISSLATEENFVTILDDRQSISFPKIACWLSIQGHNVQNSLGRSMSLSHVRSLVISGGTVPLLSDFLGLRVLDLGGCDSLQDDHLKGIENLHLLQYLVIGGKCITSIPKEIASLNFLHTLDVSASSLNELPENVFQLRHLQRLLVNSDMKIPAGIAKLEALQELGNINITRPELLKELCDLTKLRILKISIWSWNETYDGQLFEYLRSLVRDGRNIRNLSILTCCSMDFMNELGAAWAPPCLQKLQIQHSIFLEFPVWMTSLQNLSSLSINVNKLSQQSINVLGELPTLCSLTLSSKHAPEGKFGVCTDGFRNLTGLDLVSDAMGKIFAPVAEAMHKLKRVRLTFLASQTADVYQGFNFGLEELCSLKHVGIEIVCFNATRRVVKDAEDTIRKAVASGRSCYPDLEIRRVREDSMIWKNFTAPELRAHWIEKWGRGTRVDN